MQTPLYAKHVLSTRATPLNFRPFDQRNRTPMAPTSPTAHPALAGELLNAAPVEVDEVTCPVLVLVCPEAPVKAVALEVPLAVGVGSPAYN